MKKDLLTNYDRYARPTEHKNVINMNVSLSLHHVDIDEKTSMATVYGWLKFAWNDDKMKWNPADYGGLDTLHMADHEVWKPDIMLYNSALGNDQMHYAKTNCIVYSTGSVLWVPPSKFQVFCDLDLHNWPYDKQKCMIKLGSWTYSAHMLNLKADKSEVIFIFN